MSWFRRGRQGGRAPAGSAEAGPPENGSPKDALPEDRSPDQPSSKPSPKPSLWGRLRERLARTRGQLTGGLARALGRRPIDEAALEEVEERLLLADVGVEATERLMEGLRRRLRREALPDLEALLGALREDMVALLAPCSGGAWEVPPEPRPFVILMVGVNGAGKTTTIGKLARRFREQGLKVMLAAGDTFRAAAVEQLQAWGERNGVPVIAQGQGADPASVVFDALQAARARGVDVLLADTAGRLHTQAHLMEELRKVRRVMERQLPGAPHETFLVLDATNGQNALAQARQFHEALGVTGLILTKLDGTAKGGVVLAVCQALGLPIRFIGVGEGAEDLRPFEAAAFVEALLGGEGAEEGGA